MYIQAIFGPIVRRSNSACRRLSYMPPAASQAKQPLYPIMCWCQMFAWNGWSPLGTRRRHCRRRRRPLLRRKFFTKLTLAQYTNPAHEISHHRRLRVDSWQRKSEDNKSSSESEKIVKKKCRLETAATVLFRVVLALSGKCFIIVCAFTRDQNHVEKRIKIRFYQ